MATLSQGAINSPYAVRRTTEVGASKKADKSSLRSALFMKVRRTLCVTSDINSQCLRVSVVQKENDHENHDKLK